LENWIIYGIIASLAWGFYIFLMKIATSEEYYKIPQNISFFILSLGILSVALIVFFGIESYNSVTSFVGGSIAFASGLVWGIGMAYAVKSLSDPFTPISKLTPLYNTNTLVATIVGIIFLKEVPENRLIVIIGALLVVFGGFLVVKQTNFSEFSKKIKLSENFQLDNWIIYGLIASLTWGIYALLIKLAVSPEYYNNNPYMSFLLMSFGILFVSLISIFKKSTRIQSYNIKLILPFVSGMIWAIGMLAIIFALYNLQADIAKIVPLYNTNTIFAAFLGIILLHEGQTQRLKIIIGAILIITGGSIVSIF